MNSGSEIATYRRALEEAARFGRVMREGGREQIVYLEALWRLAYQRDDPLLHELGEGG